MHLCNVLRPRPRASRQFRGPHPRMALGEILGDGERIPDDRRAVVKARHAPRRRKRSISSVGIPGAGERHHALDEGRAGKLHREKAAQLRRRVVSVAEIELIHGEQEERSAWNGLARVHDAGRVERHLDRPHYLDGIAELAPAAFDLAGADAVLAGRGAVDARRAAIRLRRAPRPARSRRANPGQTPGSGWKLPSPTWPTIGAIRPLASISAFGRDQASARRDRHADVRRDHDLAGTQCFARVEPRVAPSTAGCGLPAASPAERAAAECSRRAPALAACSATAAGCHGTRGTGSAAPGRFSSFE